MSPKLLFAENRENRNQFMKPIIDYFLSSFLFLLKNYVLTTNAHVMFEF